MAKDDEITREPIERGKSAAVATPAPDRQGVVREAIDRRPPAAAATETPSDYGFNTGNILHAGKEGLYELGKGAYQTAKDVLFSEGADKSGQTQYGAGGLVGMTTEGFHPIDRASHLAEKYIGAPAKAEARQAGAYAGRGEYFPAAGHALAAALPVVGPWAASLGEQAGTGDVGGALTRGGTQVLAGELVPRVAGETVGKARAIGRGLQRLGELGEETPPAAPETPRPLPTISKPAAPGARSAPLPEVRSAAPKEPPISLGTRPAAVPESLPRIRPAEEGAPVTLASRPGAAGALPSLVRRPGPETTPAEFGPLKSLEKPEENVTLSKTELQPIRQGATAEETKFHELFGPEYQQAADLAEWETGSPEGAKPGLTPIPRASLDEIVNAATGNKPLERNTPLKEQITKKPAATEAPIGEEKPAETDPIKVKYPDPAVRKFVRANGEKLVDAVGDDQDLLQRIHDLKNVDVRQAAINAGIDLGTKHVGSKGELGAEQISRQELLTQILEKGIKPADIPELAKPKGSL